MRDGGSHLTLQERDPMPTLADLTTIVVNYRTLEHTRACLQSLRAHYPTLGVLVIDNGSRDASLDYLVSLAASDPHLTLIANQTNIFHGPALHQGMRALQTDFAFLLDSDCTIEHGGFLEALLDRFATDPLLYAIGKRGWTDRLGYGPVSQAQRHTAYVHPFAGVFDRRKYETLPPFVHHGAPLYRNMWGARRAGYHLEHVCIEDHVTHLGKVTASQHGYGYDWRLETQWQLHRVEVALRRRAAALLGRELVPPPLPPDRSDSAAP
jgi:glycosyltransferase involved in cell wall biosynthesis